MHAIDDASATAAHERETDEGESYLTVEVIADSGWMNFYLGRRLEGTDVSAMGTVAPS